MAAVGFVEPWSVKAGTSAGLYLSCNDPSLSLRIVQLDKTEEPWPASGWGLSQSAPIAGQDIGQGAWIEIPLDETRFQTARCLRLSFECLLTLNPTPRTLMRVGAIALQITPEACLLTAGSAEARSTRALRTNHWMNVVLTIAEGTGRLVIDQGDYVSELVVPLPEDWQATRLCLGGDEHAITVNARYARPAIAIDDIEVATWQFPPGPPAVLLAPVMGDWPALTVHNRPTFGVASPRWDGTIHDPRLDPTQYDAIHCHDDDMAALDWPLTYRIDVPEDASSGIYAVEVLTQHGIERMPFFVRSHLPRASLVFLVPTLTYLAYADEALPQALFPWHCDDRGHRFAENNGLLSLYDRHSDGSGVSLTTARRPRGTLRDDYLYPLSGSPHLLPVDLRLLRFCRGAGISFDVLTDHDLHDQGAAALGSYRAVFTGSHPEYWTTPMQNALQHFVDRGGSVAYLGGNGCMWVTAIQDDLVEVRRGQGLGARTWDGRPGESNLSLTGEIGGLWRERGRSEYSVLGTGMTMMGFGPSRPYQRRSANDTDAYAWIFDGVADDSFGGSGTVLGGAAGYEVDRTDHALGTHPETVTIATATGFDDSYATDPNEFFPTSAERDAARIAEMVIRRTPQGGMIFGVGSVAWCGALPNPGQDNAVGTITANVLRRLSQPDF